MNQSHTKAEESTRTQPEFLKSLVMGTHVPTKVAFVGTKFRLLNAKMARKTIFTRIVTVSVSSYRL